AVAVEPPDTPTRRKLSVALSHPCNWVPDRQNFSSCSATARRIKRYLESICNLEDPRRKGRPLHGQFAGYWRYRVGDYRIDSSGCEFPSAVAQPPVEYVTQAVAEHAEAEHRDGDCESREQRHVRRGADGFPPDGEHAAPAHLGWLRAEAEEAE